MASKKYKITHLTRPQRTRYYDKQGSKKEPGHNSALERLRVPNCYLVEQTALGYTIFFKGRTQYIQGGSQQHGGTTWTKGSRLASVYPSSMWYRIRCWSAPDSLKTGGKDQPRTAGWRNISHITRLPTTTATYLLVQCRCKISLPLISITRLPLATTRYIQELRDMPGGCSTSQTIIFMATEISDHATKCSINQNSTPGEYL